MSPYLDMGERVVNWAGNVAFEVERRVRPRALEELVALIAESAKRAGKVKVFGSGHSRSEIAETTGLLVEMAAFRALEVVDRERRLVRVGAGITLRELCAFLAEQGLGLLNQPSVAELSVVGALATGSHGSGLSAGLCSLVVRLQVLDARGALHELSCEAGDGDAFFACSLGLGALGIVTEVTLRTVEAFAIEEETVVLPFEEAFGEDLWSRARRDDYHQYYWLPHTERALLFRRNRVAVAPGQQVLPEMSAKLTRQISGALLRTGEVFPALIPAINRIGQNVLYRQGRRVARSSAILCVELPGVFHELEYAVPAAAGPAVLAELRQLFSGHAHVANFPVIVRFAPSDESLLSPAFGRDTIYVSVAATSPPLVSGFRAEVERVLSRPAGRPHWGKLFGIGARELLQLYPESYPRFVAVMRRHDPDGMFENAFLRRCFPREARESASSW